jgi:hypothetical protein
MLIRVARGSFYLDEALYDRWLHGVTAIAVRWEAGRVLLVPLRQPGSGGRLLKLRNARGDRVVHASEFLRELGVDDDRQYDAAASWDERLAAIVLSHPVWGRVPGSEVDDAGRRPELGGSR